MAKVFLILVATVIGTVQSFASTLISCTSRQNSPVTWQFVFTDAPSKLASNVTGTDANGIPFVVPALLAQYSNDGRFIDMLTDDGSGNIVWVFSSHSKNKGTLPARLTLFANNIPDSVFLLFCTETPV